MELRSTAYMWRVIENCLPAKIKSEVKGMTMFEDRLVSITSEPVWFHLSQPRLVSAAQPSRRFCPAMQLFSLTVKTTINEEVNNYNHLKFA